MIFDKKEIPKMSQEERKSKLLDLKIELTKSNVTANKSNAKTKEIKKSIARFLTFNRKNTEAKK